MINQIFIGLFTEGKSDDRFLKSVVQRSFEEIAFESNGDFEITVNLVSIDKTELKFTDQVVAASKKGIEEFGISILCVHSDADHKDDTSTYNNKIIPAIVELEKLNDEYCKVFVAIVPVQMIEAWLLADKELLKREIGTTKSDSDLNINRKPETISNPKNLIENAIRIARAEMTQRRRRDLSISELYLPIGQKIQIEKLKEIPSYVKFMKGIKNAFLKLNYLN